jgi:hypothetical protein
MALRLRYAVLKRIGFRDGDKIESWKNLSMLFGVPDMADDVWIDLIGMRERQHAPRRRQMPLLRPNNQ